MSRLQGLLYDIILAISGALAFALVIDQSVPSVALFKSMPAGMANALMPLKKHTVGVMGLFTALLLLRFVLPRTTGEEVVELETVRPVGLDYGKMDKDDPKSFEKITAQIGAMSSGGMAEIPDLVDEIILGGTFLGASDIHIEPKGKFIKLAYRVDGLIRDVVQMPKELEHPMMNRLKITSKLDISKNDAPQDGRIESKVRGRALNLRVSIFPTLHGEKAVIRVLDSARKLPKLDEFGIREDVLADFGRLLHAPQGMVLFTGPTGSGKTTLMYSSLREILEQEESKRNIVTLEDPIEQVFEDINQSQIDNKRGLTFAVGLRTLLRQDPDIIMVGEVRDVETGQIALQAAQTGHLILSTIHANSASAAFGRLIEMGVEPFLLVSAVSGIIAQRLVRRICPHCPVRRSPPAALLEQIGIPRESNRSFFEGEGCSECNQSGFAGRMAVIELLKMNDAVADAVLRKSSAPDIEKAARSKGMVTLLEDGLAKVNEGHTSLVELLRVVQ
jgi:type II secretory ATPase GspE/PulE/Tfp pilus assembly ATPase PilB-like protein